MVLRKELGSNAFVEGIRVYWFLEKVLGFNGCGEGFRVE
jgi:hypothetical protein